MLPTRTPAAGAVTPMVAAFVSVVPAPSYCVCSAHDPRRFKAPGVATRVSTNSPPVDQLLVFVSMLGLMTRLVRTPLFSPRAVQRFVVLSNDGLITWLIRADTPQFSPFLRAVVSAATWDVVR